MPKLSHRQEPLPDAYHEGHGLDSLIVRGVDAGADRRALLRSLNDRRQQQERAAERALHAQVLPGTEAAVIARQRSKEGRG